MMFMSMNWGAVPKQRYKTDLLADLPVYSKRGNHGQSGVGIKAIVCMNCVHLIKRDNKTGHLNL